MNGKPIIESSDTFEQKENQKENNFISSLFTCAKCGEHFKQESHLVEHIMHIHPCPCPFIHTELTHVCSICKYRFGHNSHLLKHTRRKHPNFDKPIPVLSRLEHLKSECDKSTNQDVKIKPECGEYFESGSNIKHEEDVKNEE